MRGSEADREKEVYVTFPVREEVGLQKVIARRAHVL